MRYISALLLLMSVCNAFAQYSYERTCINSVIIPAQELPYNKVSYKNIADKIRIYEKSQDTDAKLIAKTFDTRSFNNERTDTIRMSAVFPITDVTPTLNYDVITGYKQIIVYDRKLKRSDYLQFDSLKFNFSKKINDSLIVLYINYCYHPADGVEGFHLYTFNLNNKKIISSHTVLLPGIALSPMTINLLECTDKYIYIITALTGELYKYDTRLQFIGKTQIPVPWQNYSKNRLYEYQTDSVITTEYNRLGNLYRKYGRDSVRNNKALSFSTVYNKGFIAKVINETRAEYEFLEKSYKINDSILLLTKSSPDYLLKYRDVFYYNINQNRIDKTCSQWRCARKDTLTRFEDFFVVDLLNDPYAAPVFIDKKVYFHTIYNTTMYENGGSDELKKKLLSDVKKNGYRWELLEYGF